MSSFDERLEKELAKLEEEKKKKKQIANIIGLAPVAEPQNRSLLLGKYSYLPSITAPVRNTASDTDDIAPVRTVGTVSKKDEEDGKLDFFQKGAFEDGYQIGDVTKTILGTVGDVGLNALKGVASLGEGVGDLITYGIAGIGDAVGKDEWADGVRKKAQVNLVDQFTKGADDYLNQYSVLGRTSDAILQGVGQVGGIIATGGAGAAAGLSSAGVTALTTGVMGLSGMGSGMGEAYQGGATDEEAAMYGAIAGAADALSELMFGGLGKAVKATGLSVGLSSADDMLAKKVSSMFSSQLAKNIASFGIKAGAEGFEEVVAGTAQAIGKKITYMSEEDLGKILEDENLLEQFVVGAVTSGIAQAPGLHIANKTGSDFITGQTQNEQAVIKKEIENRIAEAEKDGKKLTAKEKSNIEAQVEKDMEKGYISTDTIEEVLGGETYQRYKKTVDSENALIEQQKALQEEFDTLNKMKQGEMTGEQIDRRTDLKEELAKLKETIESTENHSARDLLKQQLSESVSEMVRSDRLIESYNERSRRGQAFEADLTKYDTKQRAVVQKAVDSGILNNTNRTHEFVDMVAKISADKGVLFDFVNNAKLKESGFAVDGKTVNGFYDTKNKNIVVNMDSSASRRFVVGHEITHVLEGTDLYTELQNTIFEYAKAKGDYQGRFDSLSKLYEGIEGADVNAELTADLVGEYLFTDDNFINNLSTSHRNVFQKIYDEVKYLLKVATAGSKEARELEKVKRAFEKAYRESENASQSEEISDSNTKYSIREEAPPKNTGVAYKVFFVKDGKLYPPMVANPGGADTPMGVWLNADMGTAAPPSKTGRAQVKAGGKGTQGGGGSLAFRPGWHLGDLPRASQFDRVNPETGKKELFPENFVWAEVEYAKDVDYQEEAMSYGYTDNGKFRHAYAGLPRLPENGYYRYRTNPKPDTVPWVITGAMKVNRLLSDAEVNAILEKNGVPPVHRQGGDVGLEKFGFNEDGTVKYSLANDGNGATFKGRPFWSGSVSLLDGVIEEVHTYKQAENADFHHSMYFSPGQVEKMANGENGFFWVDRGNVYGEWRDSVPQEIIDSIERQIVKYSLSDSDGRQLSKEQQEYFKNSKMRDADGNLKVMYHGTQDGGFHVFDPHRSDDGASFFFVDRNTVATSYSGTSETYAAQSFKTADDFNRFFAEIGADEYEVKETDGKFHLYEDGDFAAESDTAEGIYEEFRDWSGKGYGNVNYKVYLNLENPYIFDAKGAEWNGLPNIQGEDAKYEYIKLLSYNPDNNTYTIEYAMTGDPAPQTKDVVLFADFDDGVSTQLEMLGLGEELRDVPAKPNTTRDYAEYARKNGYDGVILKNIVDAGGYGGDYAPATVAIAFDSNQIKSVANTQPTGDADIRYSLSEDSNGKKLSKEQSEFFKDSVIRDTEGKLMPMYHGTMRGGFTVFGGRKDYWYFTNDKKYAYTFEGRKANGQLYPSTKEGIEKGYYNPQRYTAYLNVKNPFVTDDVDVVEDALYWDRSLAGKLREKGYDALMLKDMSQVIVLNPNQIKNVSNRKPTSNPDIRYSLSEDSEGRQLSPATAKRFSNSKAVDENGKLLVLYHGTAAGEFSVFDKSKGSVEGDFGSGFYFTNDDYDVEENYEGGGPDFDNKVARLAEQIEQEEDIDYEEAEERAKAELFKGSHKFEVYLNIENPAIVGETMLFDNESYLEQYNEEDFEGYDEYIAEVEQLLSDDIENIVWEVENNVDVYSTDGLADVLFNAYYEGGIGVEDLKKKINELYLEDSNGNLVGNEVTRQIIESLGYDGIIDPTVSTKFNMGLDEWTTHYIAFKPNQIKAVTNQNPTDNPDIHRSLSEAGAAQKPVSDPLSDLRLEIAPVAENSTTNSTVAENSTVSETESVEPVVISKNETTTVTPEERKELFPDNLAPADIELDNLNQQKEALEARMLEMGNTGDLTDFDAVNEEYLRVIDRLAELENEVAETEADRIGSLDDTAVPPEMEAPYVESSNETVENPFEDRDWYKVGNRSVNAYMYENPEVKPFFQEEALGLMSELRDTTRGERFYNDQAYLTGGNEEAWTGVSRHTSKSIETLLDSWHMSYDDIEKGLNAIIEDNGAENIAAAKKIEFMLNDRLLNGYTDFYSNSEVPPNQDYINLLAEKQINAYSKEAFDSFMANADQYIPAADDIAPVAKTPAAEVTQDIAPMVEATGSREIKGQQALYEQITPKRKKEPRMVRADKPIDQTTANVLVTEPKVEKKRNRLWSMVKENILDNGMVFEDLALKTKNRNLQAKWNYIRYAQSMAQRMVGKGTENVKSLDSIRNEVEKSGKTQAFFEYLYHWLNVDRMTLENRYEDTPNKAVFGDSVTADMSRAIAVQLGKKNPEFRRWAQDVYRYNRHLRTMMVNNGVISQETADLWQDMYPHYVPIRRVGDKGLNINVPLDTGRTGVNAPVKKATGGNSDILPLFDTMGQRTLQTFKAIAKNSFGVELKNTLGTTITKEQTDVDGVIDSMDNHEELLQKGKNGNKPTFTVFENGEKVTFEITDEMYNAMKPASDLMSYTNPVANVASNLHRGLLTEYNPVFMATNAIKDTQDILINSQHPVRTYANLPRATWEIARNGKWFREYMEHGGEDNTYFDGENNSFDTEEKGIRKLLGIPPLSWISKANNFIERTPRLAEYIASRESGRSIEVSMLDAARVTTNFAAGGKLTKFANRNGVTFLNASIQGVVQQARNFREAKANGLKGWAQLAGKFALAGLPAMLLNNLMWDDDEEYEELSDYVKQNYYIVGKYGDGKFVRIPKGRTLAVIQSAFEQISNAATGNDEVDLKSFLELVVSNLAPNNPAEDNILAPIIQVARNETWYGEDLVPTRLQDLPAAEQFDESTDAISKWLGEKLNYSPYKINYLLDQYSGGIGDTFLPMLTPEAESGDNSIIGNVLAPAKSKFTTDSVMNNQNVSDFYDLRDELTMNAKSSKATDEDKLKSKFINSVGSELSELYAKKRELQNSNLSAKTKYEQVRDVQKQIVDLMKEGMSNYQNVSYEGEYARVGDRLYTKNDDGEWQKLSDEQITKYEVTKAAGDSPYATDGTNHYRWYEPGEDAGEDAEPGWRKVTEKELERQNEVTSGLGITPEEYWGNKDEYSFAYENPESYAVAKAVGGYDAYKQYSSDLYDIKADKDENGKSISGSRKEKVLDYINSLDADYYTKLILFKSEYTSYDDENYEIIEYLNSREDISFEEEVNILRKLGFSVDSEGNISWD